MEELKDDAPRGDVCPHCGTPLEHGFGLAGGGYGVYTFCPNDKCGEYFEKFQVHD
jgi:hypothetical protein